MRHLLTIALLLVCAPAAAQETDPGIAVDRHGHPFKTSFDRQERAQFDVGLDEEIGLAGRFSYRTAVAANFPEEEIWWQLRHGLGNIVLDADGVEVRLVEADYLRHDLSSWILVPIGDDNIRLPGDFDIVVRWNLLGIEAPTSLDRVDRWEIVEVDLLLDFVRDPDFRHRFALGPSAEYEILPGPTHRIVPLSSARILYAWENRRGTFAVQTEADYARAISLAVDEPPAGAHLYGATGKLEWTPIAINDQPLALFVDAEWRATEGFEIFAGLRLAIQDPE